METIAYDGLTPKQVKKDIKYCMQEQSGIKFMGDYKFYQNRRSLYLNPNDVIGKVVPDVVSPGDKVLTVASSGDYLLKSIFNGADEITTFDINRLQYYIANLKFWAIQTLNYDEYINLFHNPFSLDYMSPELIGIISSQFKDDPSHIFWDEFIKHRDKEIATSKRTKWGYSEDELAFLFEEKLPKIAKINDLSSEILDGYIQYLICSQRGRHRNPQIFHALSLFSYKAVGPKLSAFSSNKENFYSVQNRTNHVKASFVNSDLLELQSNLSGQEFDSVLLSNIPYYLDPSEFEIGLSNLSTLMKQNGGVSYYYHHMSKEWFDDYLIGKEFLTDESFNNEGNKGNFKNALVTYKEMIKKGIDISIEELPSGYSIDEEQVNTDVKCLVKNLYIG